MTPDSNPRKPGAHLSGQRAGSCEERRLYNQETKRMRVAPEVVLTEDQKRALQQWARGRSLPARQVERARVVLLAAAGKQDLEIAAEVGISNQTAARWRKRFLRLGLP